MFSFILFFPSWWKRETCIEKFVKILDRERKYNLLDWKKIKNSTYQKSCRGDLIETNPDLRSHPPLPASATFVYIISLAFFIYMQRQWDEDQWELRNRDMHETELSLLCHLYTYIVYVCEESMVYCDPVTFLKIN